VHGLITFTSIILAAVRILELVNVKLSVAPDARVVLDDVIVPVSEFSVAEEVKLL